MQPYHQLITPSFGEMKGQQQVPTRSIVTASTVTSNYSLIEGGFAGTETSIPTHYFLIH